MAKPIPGAELTRLEVIFRHLLWLPAAGLNVGHWPPALKELAHTLIRNEQMLVFKSLPILERFAGAQEIDMDDLGMALAGTDGFLVQFETPKRRWFSDGGERVNWGDTWYEWAYVKKVSDLEAAAVAWAKSNIEMDGFRHARVEENVDA